MEKNYGITEAELQMIMDRYVLKQGDTMDVERLREGLKELIHTNNKALVQQFQEMLDSKS
ncbi:MAG TPA: hypothetical protein VLK78_08110 [Candidatus Angelobacter sp.]|nr:hypothetical protein [Candidatus Angelobacter sp.]